MTGNNADIKRGILLRLARDEQIFNLIGAEGISFDCAEDLIGLHLFPFLKVDYTIQNAGVYIGIKLDYPSINKNTMFKNARLTVMTVVSNGALMRHGYCLTDLIGDAVLNNLNHSDFLGLPIELSKEREDPFSEDFYYKEQVFSSISPNSLKCGS